MWVADFFEKLKSSQFKAPRCTVVCAGGNFRTRLTAQSPLTVTRMKIILLFENVSTFRKFLFYISYSSQPVAVYRQYAAADGSCLGRQQTVQFSCFSVKIAT